MQVCLPYSHDRLSESRIPNPESRLSMRYLVCLIGGALLGALVAITLANISAPRHA